MRALRAWLLRFGGLFARQRRDRALSDELESHLQMHIEDNLARGMTPAEARRQALIKLGGVEQTKENYRERRGLPFLDTLLQDVRFAFRMLRKSPGFTVVAVLTLALGIGANTAIFTFVDALYLKPLAVQHPEKLMRIYAKGPSGGYGAGFSGPEFNLVRDHASSFVALSAETQIAQLHVVANGDSEEVRGAFVSANYFSLLGVQPRLGRTFTPDEDIAPDRDAVVVISSQLWETSFGSNPAALGSEIHINRIPFKIIGIAPAGFYGDIAGMPAQVWIPTAMLHACGYACSDGSYRCTVYDSFVAKFAPGRSPTVAQAELRSLMGWSATDWPERPSRRQIVAMSANGVAPDEQAESDVEMHLLMSVTASLLLIACANLAGLLLARSATRKKEIAVRLCIGARRSRIIRQLFTESFILAVIGGVFGLWFSIWARGVLSSYYGTDSEGFHHLYDLSLDWRVLAYSVFVALLAAVFFGLIPSIRSSRQDLVTELKEGGSPGHPTSGWLRHGLVVAQVALSMVLVVSAGLLVRSGLAVQRGTNFDPQHTILLRLRPELIKYTPQQVGSLVQRVVQTLNATSGVQSVGFMEGGEGLVWNSQNGHELEVAVPGKTQTTPASSLRVKTQDVNAMFFETLRMPLLQGRSFTEQDHATAPSVAIVNQALAHRLWPRASGMGQILLVGGKPYQVVGVAADIQPPSDFQPAVPHLYRSYWQSNATQNGDVRMAIRVAGDPSRELPRLRQVIQSVDPIVPIGEDMSMAEQLRLEYMPVLLGRSVMTFCGFLALILSAIGLYSVLAFAVRARTREIGIRMALGAQRGSVLQLVVGQCLKMAVIGIGIGFVAALSSARLLSSLLFGVAPADPFTFVGVAALLLSVALVACYIPARRAMRVDPMVALRYE